MRRCLNFIKKEKTLFFLNISPGDSLEFPADVLDIGRLKNAVKAKVPFKVHFIENQTILLRKLPHKG